MKIKGKKLEDLVSYLNGGDNDILQSYTCHVEDDEGYLIKAIKLKDARLLLQTIRKIHIKSLENHSG